ncbi:hypothetical protein [Halosegnis marinus]|uniref:Uncharacterized protein n=1 Tax=Halosegnis marinus TaxID=3034023 RepID=A0ABD5ZLR6_9EURY|nr:hypothetical protein [Halosegnis sp. DT85]
MTDRPVVVVVVVALALLGAVAPAVAVPTGDAAGSASGAAQAANNTTNSTGLGASISGFMQTSAASAEGEVDDEVFRGRFANASNETRRALVEQRGDELVERLERLRAQRAELLNGSDDLTVGERARAARLLTEIRSLRTAINTTDAAAAEVGVNATRLAELRENASELDGPEVAELARGLAGRGPPADRGPDRDGNTTDTDDDGPGGSGEDARGNGNGRGNGSATPGNGTDGDRGNNSERGNDGDRGNNSERGNDGDRGNNSERGDGGVTGTPIATPTPTPTATPTPTDAEGGD